MAVKDTSEQPVGGLVFFLSILFSLALGVVNLRFLLAHLTLPALLDLAPFGLALALGGVAARYLIRGHASVFLHELKHSVVANLMGNRGMGSLKVRAKTGHFEYQYTESTKAFNAFIALAPYVLPLFTVIAIGCALLLAYSHFQRALLIIGFGTGIDLILNARDISPYQSDLYRIRGGYQFGMLYILAANLMLLSFLAVWVCGGKAALLLLGQHWLNLGLQLVGAA